MAYAGRTAKRTRLFATVLLWRYLRPARIISQQGLSLTRSLLTGPNDAKEAVLFISDTSSEYKRLSMKKRPHSPSIAVAGRFGQVPEKRSRGWVISVDPAVAEVSNKERSAKGSEIIWCQRQAPGRI